MGLKRFDYKLPGQRKNIKQIAIVLCICLIAVLSFTSYALYEVRHPNDLVNSKVGEFNTSDMSLTVLVDGVKSDAFPTKDSGKVFEKLECTNGGSASWNSETWKLTINDITGPTECTINFKTGIDQKLFFGNDNSNANDPQLDNGLIPVYYDGQDWVKADTTKAWYNYDKQLWANAVTVSALSRSTYTSAAANTPIEMNDIETMWVWVPRYEYNSELLKDPNYGGTAENPGTKTQPKGIEINFISKDTVSSSSSNFTIHDAFKWGDEENNKEQLAGIWVAKFEMSTGATTCTARKSSAINSGCNLSTIKPYIKPNIRSWGGAQIGTMWTAIHENMNGENNIYGLTNSDAHLMKNMEWGAVAYLSQSKYGKYGNSAYIGIDKEVAINNCDSYITGIGGDSVSASYSSTTCTTNTYETTKGQAASTTGNIYGIYDMSGGASEYVMGIQKVNGSDEPAVGYKSGSTYYTSGWSGKIYDSGKWTTYPAEGDTTTKTYGSLNNDVPKRYYDLYEYGTSETDYTRGHVGDATYEVSGWYSDSAYFVHSGNLFFSRGGQCSIGTSVGAFNFSWTSGVAYPSAGGRPVAIRSS